VGPGLSRPFWPCWTGTMRNFRELRKGEVRRIPLPRTRVIKADDMSTADYSDIGLQRPRPQEYLRVSSERLFYAVMRGGSTSLQSAVELNEAHRWSQLGGCCAELAAGPDGKAGTRPRPKCSLTASKSRAGLTRRPGGRGTRHPGASCAAERGPDPIHRYARACRAAPPVSRLRRK
jgi:hypothetical protein